MRAPIAAAALAALALVALVPLAGADHAYTHRYVVFGTLLDSEGDPIPDVTISLSLTEGFRHEGACADQPGSGTDAFNATRNQATTNAYGEFMFCLHTHGLARDATEQMRLDAVGTGASRVVNVDPELRASFVVLQTADPRGSSPPTSTHLVQGRAWRPSATPLVIDGVTVFGDTVRRAPVSIRLPGLGAVETTTNDYGDFAVRVPIPEGERLEGDIELVVNGTTILSPVDAPGRVNYEPLRLDPLPASTTPASPTPTSASASPRPTPTQTASTAPTASATPAPTGSSSPSGIDTPFPWLAGVALCAALAVALPRRR